MLQCVLSTVVPIDSTARVVDCVFAVADCNFPFVPARYPAFEECNPRTRGVGSGQA